MSSLALSVLQNTFALLHQPIIHRLSVVLDISAHQDPKLHSKSLVQKEPFAPCLRVLFLMIVIPVPQVIFVPRLQCRLLFAPLAIFVHLLPTSHSPAPQARLEILPCSRVPTIACHARQVFIVTEVHHPVQVGDALRGSVLSITKLNPEILLIAQRALLVSFAKDLDCINILACVHLVSIVSEVLRTQGHPTMLQAVFALRVLIALLDPLPQQLALLGTTAWLLGIQFVHRVLKGNIVPVGAQFCQFLVHPDFSAQQELQALLLVP